MSFIDLTFKLAFLYAERVKRWGCRNSVHGEKLRKFSVHTQWLPLILSGKPILGMYQHLHKTYLFLAKNNSLR